MFIYSHIVNFEIQNSKRVYNDILYTIEYRNEIKKLNYNTVCLTKQCYNLIFFHYDTDY